MLPRYLPALWFWLGLLTLPLLLPAKDLTQPSTAVIQAVHKPLQAAQKPLQTAQKPLLYEARNSAGDLAVGGELAGLPMGTVRFARYEDLLKLPQETYTIADDTNFRGSTTISGVPLETLAKLFGQASHSNIIIAICDDKYRSNYPSEYVVAHHPMLVLKINGKLRDQWPLSDDGGPLGPYLISHPTFKPSFKILSHEDEAQIPFGVVRLEFRNQAEVYAPIQPPGQLDLSTAIGQGYEIARQDCFRCHGLHNEGGERATRSWLILAAWAASDPTAFQKYIRRPQSIQRCAKMPAHTDYDDATLAALSQYFSTFLADRTVE